MDVGKYVTQLVRPERRRTLSDFERLRSSESARHSAQDGG